MIYIDNDSIHLSPSGHQFVWIDHSFIDDLMPQAPGEFVKVYLLLMRMASADGSTVSIPDLADRLRCTEGDIRRACQYWIDQGAWRPTDAPELSAKPLSISAPKSALKAASSEDSTVSPRSTPTDTVDDIVPAPQALASPSASYDTKTSADICEIIYVGEQYFGRPLSVTEAEKLTSFYTQLHLNTEVITYLMEYCIENNHKSIHYMERVAANWAENGVTTVSKAMEAADYFLKSTSCVLKEFGISGRILAEKEADYVKKWQREYGFTSELITLACRRTIDTIHQASFKYVDKMLTAWLEAHVQTAQDVEALDRQHQKEKEKAAENDKASSRPTNERARIKNMNNFDEREYDMGELERQLIGAALNK